MWSRKNMAASWLCLSIAALSPEGFAASEIVRVMDDFESTDVFFTDAGRSTGLPPAIQPEVGTISIGLVPHESPLGGASALRVDYDVAWKQYFFAVFLGRSLNGSTFPCENASYVSLKYRVVTPQSRPGAASVSLALLDSSDCAGAACAQTFPWRDVEFYQSFQYVLDDSSGRWHELRMGLCGKRNPASPFFSWHGFKPGNLKLDPGDITAFWILVRSNLPGDSEPSRGAIEFDDLVCVEPGPDEEPVDPCAIDSARDPVARADCHIVEGVSFDLASAARKIVWGVQRCCELCAADPTCLYFAVDTNNVNRLTNPIHPSCYIFDSLQAADVLPSTVLPDDIVSEAHWTSAEAKRGLLCDRCTCGADGSVSCRGRDLATVPAASPDFEATALDLSANPRLVLIGPGAFAGFDRLQNLTLPGLAHLAPAALRDLPQTVDVHAESGGNAITSPSASFYDICCGRGQTVAGVTFCDLKPDIPGEIDAFYEPLDEATVGSIFGGLEPYASILRDSPLFAEASESASKCAAYCDRDAPCKAFQFSDAVAAVSSARSCFLYEEAPDFAAPRPPMVPPLWWTGGLPPRSRAALQGARVLAMPEAVELTEGNNYVGYFELFLGATPLRGAVWVTPRLQADFGLSVTFTPERVALYDNATRARVDVSVQGVTRGVAPVVEFDVEACDQAFVEEPPTVQLDVIAPPPSDSKSNRARRLSRRFTLAAIVIAVIVGLLGLIWLARRAVLFARKKAALEADRAMHVRRQVSEAMQQVEEFQAAYATLPGDKFVDLKRLKPHETLRDENLLVVYDSLASVRTEMRRGMTFVFVSHQWLAFDQPDPHGVHFASIKQAIRNVADENEIPLSSIRVWVDIFSIPQKNRSEQRLAIVSLPTFASACNYFVVVAPNTKHLNTGCDCDSKTYRKRAWCRAEIMSCWARNGTDCMFVSTNQGLRSLADNEQVLLEALDVMDGDLTCCRLGHKDGVPCDREELMLPMLGLYAEIYRGRFGERKAAYAFVEPIKDKLYPKSFTYTYKDADGVEKSEDSVLFGDLVKAAELAVDLSVAGPDDPLWRSAMPDLAPGTDAPRRSHHLKKHHVIAEGHSRSLTLKRSLSTVVTSSFSSDGSVRVPPPRLRSSASNASNRSSDEIGRTPDRGGRPQLLRSMTWRASAPRLPGLDDSDQGDGLDV